VCRGAACSQISGALTIRLAGTPAWNQYRLALLPLSRGWGWEWEGFGWGAGWSGTLLGPEGTGPVLAFWVVVALLALWLSGRAGVGFFWFPGLVDAAFVWCLLVGSGCCL
jgi:hypothetical protein